MNFQKFLKLKLTKKKIFYMLGFLFVRNLGIVWLIKKRIFWVFHFHKFVSLYNHRLFRIFHQNFPFDYYFRNFLDLCTNYFYIFCCLRIRIVMSIFRDREFFFFVEVTVYLGFYLFPGLGVFAIGVCFASKWTEFVWGFLGCS